MTQNYTSTTIGRHRIGDGPENVIVLHDWYGDHTTFDPVFRYLDTRKFSYAFADLRGYGLSRNLVGNGNVDEIASDVLVLADSLGWQRFHLVGHSLSGMAAQRVGVRASDRVKSIVAICPLSAAGSAAPDEALEFFGSTVRDDDAFRKLMRFLSGKLSEGWIEAKLKQSRTCASSEAKAAYFGMFKTNFVEEVRGSRTPILLVLGDHDPGLDEATVAPLFRSWYGNVTVATIPNCGHYPMEEAPPHFATTMEQFLAANC